MKTLFTLVIGINIVGLLAPFCGAFKTFTDLEAQANQDQIGIQQKHDFFYYLRLQLFMVHLAESATLAFLMSKLGENKYLPHDERTEAVLHGGRGSGNTYTGGLGFFRLQQELITLKLSGRNVQPYTKVTMILGRDTHKSDKTKIPESEGIESAQVKLSKLMGFLAALQKLMEDNGYEYVLYEEILLDDCLTEADVDEKLTEHLNYVTTQVLSPAKIAISMDIYSGSGNQGTKTAEKARLNLKVIKYLAYLGVRIFLHDGRSCGVNQGFLDDYALGGIDEIYGVHTNRVIAGESVQGLITTDFTKYTSFKGLRKATPDMQQGQDKKILLAHGGLLTSGVAAFELAIQNPKEHLQQAFESIVVKEVGYFYQTE